jgi:hypothetical protein
MCTNTELDGRELVSRALVVETEPEFLILNHQVEQTCGLLQHHLCISIVPSLSRLLLLKCSPEFLYKHKLSIPSINIG